MPTRKTKGRDVPRSDPLVSGPRNVELSGMMDEWRVEHSERMNCWIDVEELSLLELLLSFALLVALSSSPSADGEGGDANGFLDQLHVDENRIGEETSIGNINLVQCFV